MSVDRDLPGLRMIDAIFDNKALARNNSSRLANIANALERLGMMPDVVAELDEVGKSMVLMAERVSDAHGDVQREQMNHNSAMTSNLLGLALVVLPERAELAALKAERKA